MFPRWISVLPKGSQIFQSIRCERLFKIRWSSFFSLRLHNKIHTNIYTIHIKWLGRRKNGKCLSNHFSLLSQFFFKKNQAHVLILVICIFNSKITVCFIDSGFYRKRQSWTNSLVLELIRITIYYRFSTLSSEQRTFSIPKINRTWKPNSYYNSSELALEVVAS